jgi:hypothetical protein
MERFLNLFDSSKSKSASNDSINNLNMDNNYGSTSTEILNASTDFTNNIEQQIVEIDDLKKEQQQNDQQEMKKKRCNRFGLKSKINTDHSLFETNIGDGLIKRKELHNKRTRVSDYLFIFALIGITLMIVLIEINLWSYKVDGNKKVSFIIFGNETNQTTSTTTTTTSKMAAQSIFNLVFNSDWTLNQVSFIIKCLITLSTVILLILLAVYHRLNVRLYCINNFLKDWRIAICKERILLIVLEVVICCIHPFPTFIDYKSYNPLEYNEEGEHVRFNALSQTDIILSVVMFTRFYLLGRVLMLHSKLITDASAQSLGYLNRINIDLKFVLKAHMTQCPEFFIACFCVGLLLIASWSMQACEMPIMKNSFIDSMWMIAITFLTVG